MKKLKEKVLAQGEVTGHAHRVDVDVYEHENGTREFAGQTKVTHEEHGIINLPDNKYLSDKVIEYDHFDEEARKVVD